MSALAGPKRGETSWGLTMSTSLLAHEEQSVILREDAVTRSHTLRIQTNACNNTHRPSAHGLPSGM